MSLDFADDILKRILYKVAAAGYMVVAVRGEEFVLEIDSSINLDKIAKKIQGIINGVAEDSRPILGGRHSLVSAASMRVLRGPRVVTAAGTLCRGLKKYRAVALQYVPGDL